MMGLSSSEIKNAAMNELPLFRVIAPATKHKLIQMIMTRNATATMAEVNHTAVWVVKPRRYSMCGFDRLQSPTPFLCSNGSLLAHGHRLWLASCSDGRALKSSGSRLLASLRRLLAWLLWRERGDDLLETRIAAQRVPATVFAYRS